MLSAIARTNAIRMIFFMYLSSLKFWMCSQRIIHVQCSRNANALAAPLLFGGTMDEYTSGPPDKTLMGTTARLLRIPYGIWMKFQWDIQEGIAG
jgi:hypothetical protein